MKKEIETFMPEFNPVATFPGGKTSAPNLNWRPAGKSNPFNQGYRKDGRTDEDRLASKQFLLGLSIDLKNFKAWMETRMVPYQKEKIKMLDNADKVLAACYKLDEVVDIFNEIAKRLYDASEADNREHFYNALRDLRTLSYNVSDHNKRVKMRQTLPDFITEPRTFAAISYEYMSAYLVKAVKHERWMGMSPAQRDAARKASVRMQMAWANG